jgi:hypothetical protein
MKKILLFALAVMFMASAKAQEYRFPGVDKSPADILLYPLRVANDTTKTASIRVVYSRPSKNGRVIFGELEKFGAVWRMGANEQTEITFFKPVTIGGKSIQPGTYSMFAIPEQNEWTIILNKQNNRWGAYTYKQNLDVVRVKVPVKAAPQPIEVFSMMFRDAPNGALLIAGWDNTIVELPITIN